MSPCRDLASSSLLYSKEDRTPAVSRSIHRTSRGPAAFRIADYFLFFLRALAAFLDFFRALYIADFRARSFCVFCLARIVFALSTSWLATAST